VRFAVGFDAIDLAAPGGTVCKRRHGRCRDARLLRRDGCDGRRPPAASRLRGAVMTVLRWRSNAERRPTAIDTPCGPAGDRGHLTLCRLRRRNDSPLGSGGDRSARFGTGDPVARAGAPGTDMRFAASSTTAWPWARQRCSGPARRQHGASALSYQAPRCGGGLADSVT
jgi:hypothetical protein